MTKHQSYQFPDYDAFGHVDRTRSKAVTHTRGGGEVEFSKTTKTLRVMRSVNLLLALMVTVFVGSLVRLQIIHHDQYAAQAERNRTQTIVVSPPREFMTDRHGVRVAENVPEFQLVFDPALISSDQAAADLDSLQVPQELSSFRIPDGGFRNVRELFIAAESGSYVQGLMFQSFAAEHAGFRTVVRSKRVYPFGKSLAHIIGYVGKFSPEELQRVQEQNDYYTMNDEVGKTGVERQYQDQLKGTYGVKVVEKDALGNASRVVSESPVSQDEGFVLTIDSSLQTELYRQLESAVKTYNGSGGVIGIMEISTGELYAFADYPSYDDNIFINRDITQIRSVLNDPSLPLFARGISGQYPSGSTIKPVIALGGLNDGIITDHTTITSTGGIRVGSFFFPDWKEGGHGQVDIYQAIAESVNTYFYYVGGGYERFRGLGVARIEHYARQFGLGEKTGVDLSGEANGFIPTPEWKERVKKDRWYVGDTYHLSIGQGDLLVTPIQMLQMIAGVANDGTLISPHVALTDRPTKQTTTIPQSYFTIVKKALRDAVVSGSARALAELPVSVAGKTGTAEAAQGNPHSWFVGFFPYERPTFAIVVLVENGGEGSSVAVPLAKSAVISFLSRYSNNL